MGCLIEFFTEFVFELYLEGMMQILPKSQHHKKWVRTVGILCFIAELIVLFFSLITGVGILSEHSAPASHGWFFLLLPIVVSIIQIAIGLTIYFHNHRDDP